MSQPRREIRSISLFLVAGVLAFAVDFGVFRAGVALGATPLGARALSWWVAVTTTFAINSQVTFRPPAVALPQEGLKHGHRRERYFPYVATQLFGGMVSLFTFLALLPRLGSLGALVVATLAAASCNYLGARSVLRHRRMAPGRGEAEG